MNFIKINVRPIRFIIATHVLCPECEITVILVVTRVMHICLYVWPTKSRVRNLHTYGMHLNEQLNK